MTKPKLPTVPVPMQTVDMTTGKVVSEAVVHFNIMPPLNPNVCQTCNHQHHPHEPHNQQTLHYQYVFYGEHGRWPTWEDAMEHCSDEIKAAWKQALEAKGVWSAKP